MKRDARGAAWIRSGRPVHRPIINSLAGQRRTCLPKMNAHLVRTTGLQLTFDETAGAESLHDSHVGHGPLTAFADAAPPPSIATIPDQNRFDPSFGRHAPCDGQIPASDFVRSELPAQLRFRGRGPCEYDQSTRVAINAMHCANLTATDKRTGSISQSAWQIALSSFAELRPIGRAAMSCDSGRLIHDKDGIVDMPKDRHWAWTRLVFVLPLCCPMGLLRAIGRFALRRLVSNFDALSEVHSAGQLAAGPALQAHSPRLDEPLRLRPRDAKLDFDDRR